VFLFLCGRVSTDIFWEIDVVLKPTLFYLKLTLKIICMNDWDPSRVEKMHGKV
jgi:hypothetical protein